MSSLLYINKIIITNCINCLWYTCKYIIITYNYIVKILKIFNIFNYNNNKIINNVFFIKNNILVEQNNIHKIYSTIVYDFNYDYVIYKNNILTTIVYNIDNLKQNTTLLPCTYQFIYINIHINDKSIDITNILNKFYVIDNIIFNDIFMKWLLEYKLNIMLDKYKIIILDNNFKEIMINNKQYIKLNNKNYDIINI